MLKKIAFCLCIMAQIVTQTKVSDITALCTMATIFSALDCATSSLYLTLCSYSYYKKPDQIELQKQLEKERQLELSLETARLLIQDDICLDTFEKKQNTIKKKQLLVSMGLCGVSYALLFTSIGICYA